jgi:hypothetical protein
MAMNNNLITIELTQELLLLFRDSIRIYIELLEPHNKENNTKIVDELRYMKRFKKHIKSHADSFGKRNIVGFSQSIRFSTKEIAILKAVLPLRKQELEIDNEGMPDAACEANEKIIKTIEFILHRNWIKDIEPHELLIQPKFTEPETENQPTVINNTTVTNHNGVVAIGNNISVRQNFTDISDQLLQLQNYVVQEEKINKQQQNEILANIQTIQSQLCLEKPNSNIVKAAWESVKTIATTEGAIDFISRLAPLLESLPY